MKKCFLFFLIITVLSCDKKKGLPDLKFLGEIEFVNTLGGSKNESAQSIVATKDGGYIIAGFTQSNDGDIENKRSVIRPGTDVVVLLEESGECSFESCILQCQLRNEKVL